MRTAQELFTFVRMGGASERIIVKGISGVDALHLQAFDARKAQCFKAKDREKLLAVIESGFGSLAPFNKVIRGILKEGAERTSRLSRSLKWISRRRLPVSHQVTL